MECPFVEGQWVICVYEDWNDNSYPAPKVGERCLVVRIGPIADHIGVRIFVGLEGYSPEDWGYFWKHFRPAHDPLQRLLASRQRSKKRPKKLENV